MGSIIELLLHPLGLVWATLLLGVLGSGISRCRARHRVSANAPSQSLSLKPGRGHSVEGRDCSEPSSPAGPGGQPRCPSFFRGLKDGSWLWAWPVLPLLVLQVVGATPLTPWLMSRLEQPYLRPHTDFPEVDAVVVLGGMHAYRPQTLLGWDGAENLDRLLTGVDLSRQLGLVPLVFTGGDWFLDGHRFPGSRVFDDWLMRWNVDTGERIHLFPCADTREEAVAVASLMKEREWTRIALVTSAHHLWRSEATFRHLDIDVFPLGCEFHGTGVQGQNHWHVLPRPFHFVWFGMWLHEVIGWGYYWWQGWL